MQDRIGKPRGVLNPREAEEKFRLSRHLPSRDLEFFVERYWIVEWDLRDQEPYLQETLPHPAVNLVIEKGASKVYGVVSSGKFAYLLTGNGRVFGVKFRPGAFYPFLKSPVSSLTDDSISLSEVFGTEGEALETTILSSGEDAEMVESLEAFIRERLPDRDENVTVINRIVDCVISDRDILRVDDLARRFDLTVRTLQRIFDRYVGVSPKWVICRYRLQEAADRLSEDEGVDLPDIAMSLGYFDQAHFIRDFKALVGVSPAEYARDAGRNHF
ncbi:helix-turn-helix domain-containing protein [soil metagenome]